MKTNCIILEQPDFKAVQKEIEEVKYIVQTAAGTLAARIRTKAPKKSGDLISGIIPSKSAAKKDPVVALRSE